MAKITFNNKKNLFFRTLRDKVDQYFEESSIKPTGNRQLYLKSAFQIGSAVGLYILLVFLTPPLFLAIPLASLFGLNLAVLGFNIMHEGGHHSYSRRKWLNVLTSYFLNALGGNAYFWKMKHNVNHHTYTNIEGHDSDIDVKPIMRLHSDQPRYWIHKFQHFYWVLLYGVSYFAWIFYQDFLKYFSGRIVQGEPKKKLNIKEHFIFWISKILYVGAVIVVPIFMMGLMKALIGYAIVSFSCGLFITIVFQLAHMVEATQMPTLNQETNKIDQEWAIHQVQTTANFATKSKLAAWLLGGLNFQVEHHLFPKVSHVHYPRINKIIRETCLEFNVAYTEYPTMYKAFRSHLHHLRRMGNE